MAQDFPARPQIVAATVRANKDRIPNVSIGGSQKVEHQVAQMLVKFCCMAMSLAERPNQISQRFRISKWRLPIPRAKPREGRGNKGYWIFPTLKQYNQRSRADGKMPLKSIRELGKTA
jgi:hypothetical protein